MLHDGKIQELLKTIQGTIKIPQTQPLQKKDTEQHTTPIQSSEAAKIIKPSTRINVKRPTKDWSVDDIHTWFSSCKVPDTGKLLRFSISRRDG
ncbi:unnamed protein product [Rotaria socialis]|nr:unnamed protein product [Rotaria socialis]